MAYFDTLALQNQAKMIASRQPFRNCYLAREFPPEDHQLAASLQELPVVSACANANVPWNKQHQELCKLFHCANKFTIRLATYPANNFTPLGPLFNLYAGRFLGNMSTIVYDHASGASIAVSLRLLEDVGQVRPLPGLTHVAAWHP